MNAETQNTELKRTNTLQSTSIDSNEEASFKKPKLNEHIVSSNTEGAHFKTPDISEKDSDNDNDLEDLMVADDGVLHAENEPGVELKDIVDEYDTATSTTTVSTDLPGFVVPIDSSSVALKPDTHHTATSQEEGESGVPLADKEAHGEDASNSSILDNDVPINIEIPPKPDSPVKILRNETTGKYYLPDVNKEESLHARSYLKHYGAADFLDTYLPSELHTLHIYHVIRLLGFQIRERDVLEAISKVIENPDFIVPIIPPNPVDQGADDDELERGEDEFDEEEDDEEDEDNGDEDDDFGQTQPQERRNGKENNTASQTPFGNKTNGEPLPKKFAVKLVKDLQKAMNKVLSSRIRLTNFYTLDHVVEKLKTAKKVLVLTGAGISTSLGIPDFRSSQGFYSKIKHLGLDDPQDVFNYDIFMDDPAVFYNIAHMILPPDGLYSPLHSFIKLLQDKGKLLRNYTQNIDNLESFAGIDSERLIQCHGSFATATCKTCNWQIPGEKIFKNIRNCELPLCPYCIVKRQKVFPTIPDLTFANGNNTADDEYSESKNGLDSNSEDEDYVNEGSNSNSQSRRVHNPRTETNVMQIDAPQPNKNLTHEMYYKSFGVLKPDITFFGEALPAKFHKYVKKDALECDLLICIGTSLKVAPVSEIVNMIPSHVPQILINRDDVKHCEFDVSFLGLCDDIAGLISQKLNWEIPHEKWDDSLKSENFDVESVDRGVYQVIKHK